MLRRSLAASRWAGAGISHQTDCKGFTLTADRAKGAVPVLLAGLVWAIVYGLVWAVAWFGFMQATWYSALADSNRQMPWAEIWSVWAVLNVPLGIATAAYLRPHEGVVPSSKALAAVVLALWVPMTIGMVGWAWYESISRALIAVDSAVNLVGLAGASLLARAVAARRESRQTVAGAS